MDTQFDRFDPAGYVLASIAAADAEKLPGRRKNAGVRLPRCTVRRVVAYVSPEDDLDRRIATLDDDVVAAYDV
ncbi:hypothetical protein [Paludisphaera soli]|uniref:hypothetical protein n=1 Tax=Paludisphaera soli TaxID=2712865 RepID=UPI0013EB671B|nr:hypothetical protein [Paludisphaera soli]